MSIVTFVEGEEEKNVTELTEAIPKERQIKTNLSQVSSSVYCAPAYYQLQTTSIKTNLSSDARFLQQTHFLKLCNNTFI